MNAITIFNFITNIALVIFLVYKYNPFWISVNRTFWMKKVVSFTLWRITETDKTGNSISSKGVISFKIRNDKKMREWDSAEFKRIKQEERESKRNDVSPKSNAIVNF